MRGHAAAAVAGAWVRALCADGLHRRSVPADRHADRGGSTGARGRGAGRSDGKRRDGQDLSAEARSRVAPPGGVAAGRRLQPAPPLRHPAYSRRHTAVFPRRLRPHHAAERIDRRTAGAADERARSAPLADDRGAERAHEADHGLGSYDRRADDDRRGLWDELHQHTGAALEVRVLHRARDDGGGQPGVVRRLQALALAIEGNRISRPNPTIPRIWLIRSSTETGYSVLAISRSRPSASAIWINCGSP